MSLKGLIEVNPEVKLEVRVVTSKSITRNQDLSQNVVMIGGMTGIGEDPIIREVDLEIEVAEITVVEIMEEIEIGREIDTEIRTGEMIEEMTEAETMEETEIEKETGDLKEEMIAEGREEEMKEERNPQRLQEKKKVRDSQDRALRSEEQCLLSGMMMRIGSNSNQMETTIPKVKLHREN